MKKIDFNRLKDDPVVKLRCGIWAVANRISDDGKTAHCVDVLPIYHDEIIKFSWDEYGRCIVPGNEDYNIVSGHCFVEENEEKQESESNKAASYVPAGCLPFDVEKAKAGAPVVTRDGRPARIICFDAKSKFPIVALVMENNKERVLSFSKKGRFYLDTEWKYDLFMATVKREGWVNLYKSENDKFDAAVGNVIAVAHNEDRATAEADARLIAAAPELLEVSQEMALELKRISGLLKGLKNSSLIDKAEAVIKKALEVIGNIHDNPELLKGGEE